MQGKAENILLDEVEADTFQREAFLRDQLDKLHDMEEKRFSLSQEKCVLAVVADVIAKKRRQQ